MSDINSTFTERELWLIRESYNSGVSTGNHDGLGGMSHMEWLTHNIDDQGGECYQLLNHDAPPALSQKLEDRWIDIETAPKDGREVLLMVALRAGITGKCLVGHYMEGGHCIEDHPPIDAGWYFWNGCMFDKAAEPTHWQPLPPKPIG